MVTESEIQKAICKMLAKSPDILFYTVITTGMFRRRPCRYSIGKIFSRYLESTDGLSDILCVRLDGVICLIEVKSEDGKVTKEQQQVLDLVNENNGRAGVARSVQDAEGIIRGFEIRI